jgi:hypothetical protein
MPGYVSPTSKLDSKTRIKLGSVSEVQKHWKELQLQGLTPSVHLYTLIIDFYLDRKNLALVIRCYNSILIVQAMKSLHAMLRGGIKPDRHIYAKVLTPLTSLFTSHLSPLTSRLSPLTSHLSPLKVIKFASRSSARATQVLTLFRKMLEAGWRPDMLVYHAVFLLWLSFK